MRCGVRLWLSECDLPLTQNSYGAQSSSSNRQPKGETVDRQLIWLVNINNSSTTILIFDLLSSKYNCRFNTFWFVCYWLDRTSILNMSPLGIFHHYSKFYAVDEKIDTKYHIPKCQTVSFNPEIKLAAAQFVHTVILRWETSSSSKSSV